MFGVFLATSSAQAGDVLNTKHNLSSSGLGDVRALSEDRVCVFCHTPHGARPEAPLWNRRESVAAYTPYDSPTLKAQPGQPTGASKLCLSCHDGTIALGDLVGEDQPIAMTSGGPMPSGPGLIGTDLRDDHPISFNYPAAQAQSAGHLAPSGSWDQRVTLDANSDMQCTSCHDPHEDRWGDFLVMDNRQSLLCCQCHTLADFPNTAHATSVRQWNGAGEDPWPRTDYAGVEANACLNCHATHHADGRAELLSSATEEDVCFVCHNGNVAAFDLRAVFRKPYAHPVAQSQGAHEAGESPLDATGHVECADCHNPHRVRVASASAPFVQGVLQGVTGVDANGAPVAEAQCEYEVCFKCHADRPEQPMDAIVRLIPSLNTRMEFSPSSPSFHPVASVGVSGDVPSLISPLNETSLIRCSDCHNNDGRSAETPGSAGPHGSIYKHLLARQYLTGENVRESPAAYALCYECHSRASILNNESFPLHKKHVEEQSVSCSVCHDPHGIDLGEGNSMNNAHLINFDVSIVNPEPSTQRLEYRSNGLRQGECNLQCHGENHNSRTY